MEQPIVEVIPNKPGHVRRTLFAFIGLIFVGIATVGVIVPGLPTVPWLLLASYFFSKSSPRLQRWLRQTPMFGPLLQDWDANHAIRPKVKLFAIVMVVTMCTLSASYATDKFWVRTTIATLGIVGISVILFAVRTIRIKPDRT